MGYNFRAWDREEEEMLDHQQLLSAQQMSRARNKKYDIFEDKFYVIMVSLGVEDCEGTLVFEGDIVQTPTSIKRKFAYEVIRHTSSGSLFLSPFMVGNRKRSLAYGIDDFLITFDELAVDSPKVVGNIYANPKLLDKNLVDRV